MRILNVIPSLGPQRGGTSTWVRNIARYLAAEGHEVQVATTDDNGPDRMNLPLREPVCENAVTYRFFPRQSRFYTVSLPLGGWLARHTAEFDVVHIHAMFSYAALPAAFWARRRKVPYIVQPHGMLCRWGVRTRRPLLKRCSLRLLERRILEHSAAVDFTNRTEMNEAAELGIAYRPVVIPLGTDVTACDGLRLRTRFRRRHQLMGKRIVLFLSRFDRKKGIPLLLAAFARLRQSCGEAVLVMAGSGEPAYERELRAAADRLGIGDAVLWTGFLDGEDKIAALADADVFALPSYSENFGIAVVEAMALGTPVAVSRGVGIHAEIAEAGAGLVTACDEREFAAALTRMLSDAPLRANMSANARALVESRFSMNAVTAKLIELYRTASGRA